MNDNPKPQETARDAQPGFAGAQCSTAPDLRPPNTEGWWCDNCKCVVPPEMVTYHETHDSRYGGCGEPVR